MEVVVAPSPRVLDQIHPRGRAVVAVPVLVVLVGVLGITLILVPARVLVLVLPPARHLLRGAVRVQMTQSPSQ